VKKRYNISKGELRSIKIEVTVRKKQPKKVHRTNPDMWDQMAKEANKKIKILEKYHKGEFEYFTRNSVKEILGEEIEFIGSSYKNRKEFREYWGDKLMRDQITEDGRAIWSDKQIGNFASAIKMNYPGLDPDYERMKYDKGYRDNIIKDIMAYCDELNITLSQFLGSL